MITSPSDYLDNDSRYKSWGKLVTASDVDLSRTNGYSLGGQWVKFDDSVALGPGQWLVCAAESGSRKSHGYHYALVSGADGQRVAGEGRVAALDQALADGLITEVQRASAKNSTLYHYGLYIVVMALRQGEQ